MNYICTTFNHLNLTQFFPFSTSFTLDVTGKVSSLFKSLSFLETTSGNFSLNINKRNIAILLCATVSGGLIYRLFFRSINSSITELTTVKIDNNVTIPLETSTSTPAPSFIAKKSIESLKEEISLKSTNDPEIANSDEALLKLKDILQKDNIRIDLTYISTVMYV